VQGDILDSVLMAKTLKDFQPTHIIHCAAIVGIDSVLESPINTIRVNAFGTGNLLDLVHHLKLPIERVVLFSTSEIYGQHAFRRTETNSAVIGAAGEDRWCYAVSKLTNEHPFLMRICMNEQSAWG
jgi:nucleoside-diphosphate-sugar epimerase